MCLFFGAMWLAIATKPALGLFPCVGFANEQCWDRPSSNTTEELSTISVWTSRRRPFGSVAVFGDCRAHIRTARYVDGSGESANHIIASNATSPFYFFGYNCQYENRITRQPAIAVQGVANGYVVEAILEAITTSPTVQPTSMPTSVPTKFPTDSPSVQPSFIPTTIPTQTPSFFPTTLPSFAPSTSPSQSPSAEPTGIPSASPTTVPSQIPSTIPTTSPSSAPTNVPTFAPTPPCGGTVTVFGSSDKTWDGEYKVFRRNRIRPFFQTIDGKKTIQWKNQTKTWEITSGSDVISFGYTPRSSPKNFWPPQTEKGSWNRKGQNNSVSIGLLCLQLSSGQSLSKAVDIFAQLQTLGFYLPLSMFSLALVTVLVAFIYQRCHPGSDSIRWISCFRFFIQVFDVVTDVLFAYQLLALGKMDLFIAAGTFIIVPYLLSFFMLVYLIQQWRGIDIESVSQYLQRYDWVLFLFCALSGGCHAAVSLANSKMFFHKFFNMGLRRHDMLRMGKWKLWSTTLTENIPQVVIQTIYFVRVGVFGDVTDYIGIISFSMTFISLVMTSATQLTRCSRKDDLLWNEGLHFLLTFQSSKLRGWHKFSKKNMARIVAQYLEISSFRVEIYDVHTMESSGTRGLRFAGVVGGLVTTLVEFEENMRGLDTDKNKFVEGLISGFALGNVDDDTIIKDLEVEWVHVDYFDSNFSIATLGDKNIQMKYWDDLYSTSTTVSLDSPKSFAAVRAKSNQSGTENSSIIPSNLDNIMLRAQTPDPEMKPRERSGKQVFENDGS